MIEENKEPQVKGEVPQNDQAKSKLNQVELKISLFPIPAPKQIPQVRQTTNQFQSTPTLNISLSNIVNDMEEVINYNLLNGWINLRANSLIKQFWYFEDFDVCSDSSDNSDEIKTALSKPEQQKQKDIDIAFLHADILVHQNDQGQTISMSQNEMLSASIMYDQIVNQLEKSDKEFYVYNCALNKSNLKFVLTMKPKILFLNCHGSILRNKQSNQMETFLCFEKEELPTDLERCDEKSLSTLVMETQVQLVVISACHSSRLAQVFIDSGVPVVVSISASVEVLEKAAEKFNKEFINYLIRGDSPETAFKHGLSVLESDNQTSGICCCQHDHLKDCLWIKYKEKTNRDIAHNCHAQRICKQKCHNQPGYGPIDHMYGCSAYSEFYYKLLGKDQENLPLVIEKNGQNGFLSVPLQKWSKEEKNKMCCCYSNTPHNESQKFIIMGTPEAKQTPIFQKGSLVEGKVTENLPIDYKELPDWLRKESNWLFDRNIEIHKVVEFLLSEKRLLQIYGSQLSGRTAIVSRAIKIIIARNKKAFKDKVFLVDLENVGISSIVWKISEALQLLNGNPNEESLIRDLIGKKSLIIFNDCKVTKKKQTQMFLIDLVSRIVTQTSKDSRLKFIIIAQNKKHYRNFDWDQCLDIGPMSTKGKVQLFIHLMKIHDKDKRLQQENVLEKVQKHPIFEKADPQFVTKIMHEFENIADLDRLLQQLQSSLNKYKPDLKKSKQNKIQQDNKEIGNQLYIGSIFCAELLQKVPSMYYLEKNLIFFLTLTPAGISETEVRQLCKIYKKWFGLNFQLLENLQQQPEFQGDVSQIRIGSDPETNQQSYTDLIEFVWHKELDAVPIFRVDRNHQPSLELLLMLQKLELKDHQIRSQKDLISIAIEFMGSQARSLLRSIKKKEGSGELDYRLVTAHLDCGMWWRYPNEEESFDEEIKLPEQRFSLFYLTNFKYLIDKKLLNKNFPDIWSDKLTQESEYIFDLCLTVPSILVQLNRYEEAVEIINQCRQFGNGQTILLHGYLDLMLASIYVSNFQKIKKVSYNQIRQLLHQARDIFKKYHQSFQTDEITEIEDDTGHIEGRAETFFVEACLDMLIFKNQDYQQVKPNGQFKSQSSSVSQNQTKETRINQNENQGSQQDIIKRINNSIKSAITCFEKLDDGFEVIPNNEEEKSLSEFQIKINNKLFGKAKTLLAESDFFINNFPVIFQDEGKREEQLMRIKRAEELFKERGGKQNILKKQSSSCQDSNQNTKAQRTKNYEALSVCLQAQLYMFHFGDLQYKNEEIKEARSVIDRALKLINEVDEYVGDIIKKTKNQILFEMRTFSNNLFTFAKAWPLVERDKNGKIRSIGEFTTSRFELAPKILSAFNDTGLDLQIKFDFLNEELLKSVLESGSRVLHLSSDIFEKSCLYIEDTIGLCKKIKIDDLTKYFMNFKIGNQFNGQKIPVDCVVIAIPDSREIGKFFVQMGVPHVIVFDFDLQVKEENQHIESQLMPIRFNYIYTFCQEFYIQLVEQKSVRQAFNWGIDAVKDEENQLKIWQFKEFQSYNLGIIPLLLDQNNSRHDKKLFDIDATEEEKQKIYKGHLYDITKARGLLIGIQKSKDPYIGHKQELHNVMANLIDDINITNLVHIRGRKGVGKTRFVQEVAYYLYQRGLFNFKIQYEDMQKIDSKDSEQKFKDLFSEKRLYDEQRIKEVSQRNSVQILLVFDNIDLLPKDMLRRFEARLIDLIQTNPGVRLLTTSTKKFSFEKFQQIHYQDGKLNSNLSQITQNSIRKEDRIKWKMVLQNLGRLNDIQAVDLLLSACPREITKEELDIDYDDPTTVHQRLQLEQKVKDCENRPIYIKQLAQLLDKNDFHQINVQKQQDEKKNLQIHHKAKTKFIVQITANQSTVQKQLTKNQFSDIFNKTTDNKLISTTNISQNLLPFHFLGDRTMFVQCDSQPETPDQRTSRAPSYNITLDPNQLQDALRGFQDEQGNLIDPILLKNSSNMSGIGALTNQLISKLHAKDQFENEIQQDDGNVDYEDYENDQEEYEGRSRLNSISNPEGEDYLNKQEQSNRGKKNQQTIKRNHSQKISTKGATTQKNPKLKKAEIYKQKTKKLYDERMAESKKKRNGHLQMVNEDSNDHEQLWQNLPEDQTLSPGIQKDQSTNSSPSEFLQQDSTSKSQSGFTEKSGGSGTKTKKHNKKPNKYEVEKQEDAKFTKHSN